MYTLDSEQIASAENFIQSLPISIVKGNYERWLLEVNKNGRITTEQMEKFLSFAHALPVEFQNFPQHFVHSIKNDIIPDTDGRISQTSVESGKRSQAEKDESENQQKEGDEIVKRNKALDKKKDIEDKPKVVIVEKGKK